MLEIMAKVEYRELLPVEVSGLVPPSKALVTEKRSPAGSSKHRSPSRKIHTPSQQRTRAGGRHHHALSASYGSGSVGKKADLGEKSSSGYLPVHLASLWNTHPKFGKFPS